MKTRQVEIKFRVMGMRDELEGFYKAYLKGWRIAWMFNDTCYMNKFLNIPVSHRDIR